MPANKSDLTISIDHRLQRSGFGIDVGSRLLNDRDDFAMLVQEQATELTGLGGRVRAVCLHRRFDLRRNLIEPRNRRRRQLVSFSQEAAKLAIRFTETLPAFGERRARRRESALRRIAERGHGSKVLRVPQGGQLTRWRRA